MSTPDPEYVDIYAHLLRATTPADRAELAEQLHTVYLRLARGGSTPAGLPFPDPTDPIAEGADAIRRLAEMIDATRHSLTRRRPISGNNTFNNQIAWGDFTVAADADALTGTFVKGSDHTVLDVFMSGSHFLTSGAEQYSALALNIGGVDYEIVKNFSLVAFHRAAFSGVNRIENLPAGTYPVRPRFRAELASTFVFQGGRDQVSYRITETTA